MRKMYQNEWLGIAFRRFARLSSDVLATTDFYASFYNECFKRYKDWDEMPLHWREEKARIAAFLLDQPESNRKILSVGCGIGAVEHFLRLCRPQIDLYIHEVAPTAWVFVGREFPNERRCVGRIPACLPQGVRFDLVYLSAVDYCMDDNELRMLLSAIRPFLEDKGRLMLLSASFEITPHSPRDHIVSQLRRLKEGGLAALDFVGLRQRGQFWGWVRSAADYRRLMHEAGYADLIDGYIDPGKRFSYWIGGCYHKKVNT
jgi:hypothetical protein